MFGKRSYGDYQTPPVFAGQVCGFLKHTLGISPSIIIEPTCGIGNFIKSSLIFNATVIYGFEINPEYCSTCAKEIDDIRVKIINCDFFSYNLQSLRNNQNTLVIGNPPWITNSSLTTLGSRNLPEKRNIKFLKGIDALTGASNFDICECIILKLLSVFRGTNTTIAMLCKPIVARNIFNELYRLKVNYNYCNLYDFDAAKWFGISASACLLVVQLTSQSNRVPTICHIYDFDSPQIAKNSFGYEKDKFYSDLSIKNDDFDGKCYLEWRQGIKHDCAKIMELSSDNGVLINGKKNIMDIEDDFVFPLIKGSMFKKPIISDFSKFVIVTQRKSGEETKYIQNQAPKTWAYLMKNKELLKKRKSSVYQNVPLFSMFGVGEYSYSQFKVGVSGFYKEPLFSVLYSPDKKPVMLDDTGYFISFSCFENAYIAMLYLNSHRVYTFLKSLVFKDAKRPYTKKVLSRLNFSKIIRMISINELKETENKLHLDSYLTEKMVEDFSDHYTLLVPSLLHT